MASNESIQRNYELSELGVADLEDIYDHSFREFGFIQAEDYLESFHHLFEQLTHFPYEGIIRKDIKKNLRSIPIGSHIIFYYVYEKSIMIIRILHQSQDVRKLFK